MGGGGADDADGFDALPAGSTIGSYTVRRVIGRGGFGVTYEAHNRVIDRTVAIREFFPDSLVRRDGDGRVTCSCSEPEVFARALRRFEQTAYGVARLDHPNIVRLHDYMAINGTGYMVMEWLDGQSLEDWLRARPAPPRLDELRPLMDPVMAALSYAHGRGMIHGDVAPDSILITRDGRPVLIDFDWGRRELRRILHDREPLLKHHFYVALEQLRARAHPTVVADVYAVGAVLYRALTGSVPADGDDRLSEILSRERDSYAPLADRPPPGCPSGAARAVDAALALDPAKRTKTVAELRAELDPPVPVSAPPRTLIRRFLDAALARMGRGDAR